MESNHIKDVPALPCVLISKKTVVNVASFMEKRFLIFTDNILKQQNAGKQAGECAQKILRCNVVKVMTSQGLKLRS